MRRDLITVFRAGLKGAHGHRVAEVMQPHSWRQTDAVAQPAKGAPRRMVANGRSSNRYEDVIRVWPEKLSPRQIPCQCCYRTLVQGNKSALAELRLANDQTVAGEVANAELKSLGYAQPRDGQEAEERLESQWSQRLPRRQLTGGMSQASDLLLRENIGWWAWGWWTD